MQIKTFTISYDTSNTMLDWWIRVVFIFTYLIPVLFGFAYIKDVFVKKHHIARV